MKTRKTIIKLSKGVFLLRKSDIVKKLEIDLHERKKLYVSIRVKTNLEQIIMKLIVKHFQTIINISYNCMPYMTSIKTKHKKSLLTI